MSGKRTNGRIPHTKWKNPRRKYALNRMWDAHDAFDLRAEFARRNDVPFTYCETMYSAKRVTWTVPAFFYQAHPIFAMLPKPVVFA